VSLPNPGERDAGDPSLSMERLAERLLRRMAARADLACLDVSAKR
jgi:hypothetical protein